MRSVFVKGLKLEGAASGLAGVDMMPLAGLQSCDRKKDLCNVWSTLRLMSLKVVVGSWILGRLVRL